MGAAAAQPSRIQRFREAKERGDEAAMEEVRREIREAEEPRKAEERAAALRDQRRDFARELAEARMSANAAGAEAVVRQALKRERAPELEADDIVWLARQLGTWRSSTTTGSAIAAWFFHHGPVHQGLFEVAEDIAALDNSPGLDDVLLWAEPTPERWVEVAHWARALTWCHFDWFCKERGVERPQDLSTREARALFAQSVREGWTEFPRKVVGDRGDAARRALRAAACTVDDEGLRLVLEAWTAELAEP